MVPPSSSNCTAFGVLLNFGYKHVIKIQLESPPSFNSVFSFADCSFIFLMSLNTVISHDGGVKINTNTLAL